MKKIFYVIVSLAILVGAAAVLVPIFLDPNKYKTEIAQKFKDSTGYNLEIDGDIKVSLFPVPNAYVSKVAITNNSVTLVDVDEVSAYFALAPLLSGDMKISSVKIANPEVKLSKNDIGGNWEIRRKVDAEPAKENASSGKKFDLKIDKITFSNGSFNYTDRTEDKIYDVQNINIDASLASSQGPLNVDGRFDFKGGKIDVEGSVSNFTNPAFDINITGLGSAIAVQGDMKKGGLAFKTEDISSLADISGVDSVPKFPNPKFSISTKYDIGDNQDTVKLSETNLNIGSVSGSGNALLQRTGLVDLIDANFSFDKIIVSELMPKAEEATKASAKKQDSRIYQKKSKFSANLRLKANKLVLDKGNLDNLDLDITVDGRDTNITNASVSVPGGGKAVIVGLMSKNSIGKKYFEGKIEAAGKDLRQALGALGVKADSVKPGKLKAFSVDSVVYFKEGKTYNNIDLAKLRAKVDDINFSGKMDVAMKEKRPEITLSGNINSINLDKLLKESKKQTSNTVSVTGVKQDKKLDFGWLKKVAFDFKLGLGIGKIIHGGKSYNNVRLSGSVMPSKIDMQKFSFASSQASVSGKASLNVKPVRPYINANLNIPTINTKSLNSGTAAGGSKAKAGTARWSTEPFKMWPMRQIDGEIFASIGALKHDKIDFRNVKLSAEIKDAKMKISEVSANGFDGAITANANIGFGNVPNFNVTFSGNNLDLYKIASGVANNKGINGVANIAGNLSSSGLHEKAMIKNLQGAAQYAARDVYVRGFDLQSFVRQIRNVRKQISIIGVLKLADSGGKQTYIKELGGNVYGEKGVFSTKDTKMDAEVAYGLYQGYIDFPNWNVESDARFDIIIDEKKKHPGLGIRIYGPPDRLILDYDTSEIQRYLSNKLVGGLIGGDKADDINNMIDSFGGFNSNSGEVDIQKTGDALNNLLNKKSKKEEVPVEEVPGQVEEPAQPEEARQETSQPEEVDPQQQSTPEPEQQPAPEPEPQELKPEDVLIDVLKGL